MQKYLLTAAVLHMYQQEQRELQELCSRPKNREELTPRDQHDRTDAGKVLRTHMPNTELVNRNRLNELNTILSNYELVEPPTDTKTLCIGHVATFREYDAPKGRRPRRYTIGGFGETNTHTTPPTIGYEKVLPFLGQRVNHDARIAEGPMRGDWDLIKIELPEVTAANAA